MRAAPKVENTAIQHTHMYVFLGALKKLRKVTVSSCLSVCLSVRVGRLDSHWTDFH